ncbi:MAG: glycosyltransferase family 2 protein [Elusimicrobiales bacterium]
MTAPKVVLVIPFYNEEECAEKCVSDLDAALTGAGINFELLLVENGSKDRTPEILRALEKKDARIKTIFIRENIGYGGAILRGMEQAGGDWIGFTCGDGEISPEDTAWMCKATFAAGFDFCKAKRVDRKDGAVRKLLSMGYHLLVGLLFRIHVTDLNGYPVLMRKRVHDKMHLTHANWVFNIEMMWDARRLGVRMAELDVRHCKRLGGHSHVGFMTPAVFLLQLLSLWNELRKRHSPNSSNATGHHY